MGDQEEQNHIRERLWDYRLLNVEDYTFSPPTHPLSHRMQMLVWIKKEKKRKGLNKSELRRPFVNYLAGSKQVPWRS